MVMFTVGAERDFQMSELQMRAVWLIAATAGAHCRKGFR